MEITMINNELNQTISLNNDYGVQLAVISDDADNYVCLAKEEALIIVNFLTKWLEEVRNNGTT